MAKNFGPGNDGCGCGGETRYPAESAPVVKNGGNKAEHEGVVTEASPSSLIGSGSAKNMK